MSKSDDSELRLFFTTTLLDWSKQVNRNLPWKKETQPYPIWLSEIILQQTRVEQGTPYYQRFIQQFPTITDLALAPEDEVFKLWEGLGYYSRARNLHETAKFIAFELNGVFPNTYESIKLLKGVGDYTAAAIASFAYHLPHAVLDGNVYRVLARFFGISTPTDTTTGKKEFQALAQSLLDTTQPAAYNQAIMDFGAVCCLPKSPNCKICPMSAHCFAFQQRKVELYPFKSKRVEKKTRYFHYLYLLWQDQLIIEKRLEKDIWQGLYQFPMLELDTYEVSWDDLVHQPNNVYLHADDQLLKISKPFRQTLTHQYIVACFWEIQLSKAPVLLSPQQSLIPIWDVKVFAFPKIIDSYLQDSTLYLL